MFNSLLTHTRLNTKHVLTKFCYNSFDEVVQRYEALFFVHRVSANVNIATRLHFMAVDTYGVRTVFEFQGYGRGAMFILDTRDVGRLAIPVNPVTLDTIHPALDGATKTLVSRRSCHKYKHKIYTT